MFKIVFKSCQYCDNLYTNKCPIRVWHRNEGAYVPFAYTITGREKQIKKEDVDVNKDFCSRFVQCK